MNMLIRKLRFYEGEGSGSNTPPGGQAPQGSQPPAGTGGQPNDQASGGGKSVADLEKMIADLRSENAKHRTENKDLKEFKDKAEADKLTETQRLQKEAKDAADKAAATEARLKETQTRRAIERAARKLNIVDEEAAYALLDKAKLEYDETGEATNAQALLEELVKVKTYLVGQSGGSTSSATNPARGDNRFSAEAIDKLTPQQIAALSDAEYQQVLKASAAGR